MVWRFYQSLFMKEMEKGAKLLNAYLEPISLPIDIIITLPQIVQNSFATCFLLIGILLRGHPGVSMANSCRIKYPPLSP